MISEAEKADVEAAIGEAEKHTSGEIVAVVARASGRYSYVPYLWGALAALTRPSPSHPRTVASSIGPYCCPSPPMT